MFSIAQNYVHHGQQTVCGIQFEILFVSAFEKTFLSLHKTPPNHSFLLAISYSYSDNTITATQYLICKTVQYCVKQ